MSARTERWKASREDALNSICCRAVPRETQDLVHRRRRNYRSAAGGRPSNAASNRFLNLGPVEFHAHPVTTEAASARFTQATPHADVTDLVQLSSDAEPRPTSKTLVTRLSQPFPNAIHYAPFPECGDPDTCPNFCVTALRRPNAHDVFPSGDLSAEITRLQNEVVLCRQWIASYPKEVQEMRAAMGRHERFRSELAAGFEAKKYKVNLEWRRALGCLDRRRDVSHAEHEHHRRELHRAIKQLEESSCRFREAAAKSTSCPTSRTGVSGETCDLIVDPRETCEPGRGTDHISGAG